MDLWVRCHSRPRCKRGQEYGPAQIGAAVCGNEVLVMSGHDDRRLAQALRDVYAIMGPKCPHCCQGCETEWNEALRILREALAYTQAHTDQPLAQSGGDGEF